MNNSQKIETLLSKLNDAEKWEILANDKSALRNYLVDRHNEIEDIKNKNYELVRLLQLRDEKIMTLETDNHIQSVAILNHETKARIDEGHITRLRKEVNMTKPQQTNTSTPLNSRNCQPDNMPNKEGMELLIELFQDAFENLINGINYAIEQISQCLQGYPKYYKLKGHLLELLQEQITTKDPQKARRQEFLIYQWFFENKKGLSKYHSNQLFELIKAIIN